MHVVEVRPTTAPPGSSGAQVVNVHYADGTRERVVMRDLTAEVRLVVDSDVGGVCYTVHLFVRRGGCQVFLGWSVGRHETREAAVAALWRSPTRCPLRVRVRVPEMAHARQS